MAAIDDLARALTQRGQPIIDMNSMAAREHFTSPLEDARVLVVGGAGSIGSKVVETLASTRLRGLHIIDIDESGLADLVRNLRSGPNPLPCDFRTSVVDFRTDFRRFVEDCGPFDLALNFAALKHVRSERDVYSLARMIETNVQAVVELVELAKSGAVGRVFSVSSDKAVRPHNLMGATKRWMEKVLAQAGPQICTSARFANVAFSKGSLAQAVLQRIERSEPIAAPCNVRRFFITPEEAAVLCIAAATEAGAREIFVPRLNSELHAISMPRLVEIILAGRGLEPRICASDLESKELAAARPADAAWWPCVFRPADTTGEKELEELSYADEEKDETRYPGVVVVRQKVADEALLRQAGDLLSAARDKPKWRKEDFVLAISCAVPELEHLEVNANLDDRM